MIVDTLLSFGVYVEKMYNNKWCFKYQFPGQEITMLSGVDKEKTANDFFVEFLKTMHYSIRWMYEKDSVQELAGKLILYKSWNNENVNKTIEIATRSMKLAS